MMFPPNIKAICFDAFGTLVEISEKRWPFRTLLEELPQNAAKDLRDLRPKNFKRIIF